MAAEHSVTKQKKYNIITALLGLAMAGVSFYLANHYFAVHFPTTFSNGSFCDISKFWNCDSAAFSVFSNIYNVPTAVFGLIFGLIIFFSAFIKNKIFASTNSFLSVVNFLGCLFLFIYSLVFLGGLCPGCTVYYVFSAILFVVYIFWLKIPPLPKISVLLGYGLIMVSSMAVVYFYNAERSKLQDEQLLSWTSSLKNEPRLDDSDLDFSFSLIKSTTNFADAPIRITVFSDFQCPFCKILSKELDKIAKVYKGKVNIRYVFYPLDSKCNSKLKGEMHPFACAAARLAFCAKDKFDEVHDDIYEHQTDLNNQWLSAKSKELGLEECFNSNEASVAVKNIIDSAHIFEIEGAPAILINGIKLGGLVPAKALVALIDSLLVQENAK